MVVSTAAEADTPASNDTLTLTIIVENVNEAPMFTDEEDSKRTISPGLQIKTRTVAEHTHRAARFINTEAYNPDASPIVEDRVIATDEDDTTQEQLRRHQSRHPPS